MNGELNRIEWPNINRESKSDLLLSFVRTGQLEFFSCHLILTLSSLKSLSLMKGKLALPVFKIKSTFHVLV